MPRKQRFKPSRKPKPAVEMSSIIVIPNDHVVRLGSTPASGSDPAMRRDHSSVIDGSDTQSA